MGLDFEEEAPPPPPVLKNAGPDKIGNSLIAPAAPGPVLESDSMLDINHKLQAATKNGRDIIYASAQEQELLKKMAPVEVLKEKFGSTPTDFVPGKDRVNLMTRRVRAIHSDNGESIEIDFGTFKEGNRDDYLRSIGKLPPKRSAVDAKKIAAKNSIKFEE